MKDEIVICACGEKEYNDKMIWNNGIEWCRKCTYKRWEAETYSKAKYREELDAAMQDREPNYNNIEYWKANKHNKIFPEY